MQHPKSPSRHLRRPLQWITAAAVALLLASPAAAYTIYLKSGKTIQAKGKYTVRDGKALITLPSGTQSSFNASEIDVERTEAANKSDYGGNAVILDPGTTEPAQRQAAANQQKRLSDMIANRQAARELPGPGREKAATPDAARSAAKTRAGYSDLTAIGRRPFPQADVLAELQQFFHGQGIDDVEIYSGTRPDRPLVEVTTPSEGSVFRTLGIASNALLHVRDRFPNGKVTAFELLMTTPQRERAGQFVLTPEMASDLVAKKIEVPAFFVQNVQF
jgi:hypothetical protein